MDTDIEMAAARFTDTLESTPSVKISLLRPLLTLLATGQPVTVEQLAAEAARPAQEIREALAEMPDTEYDPQGRIIGHGLTFNPTQHRYQADGRTLYTWCAQDTLFFPAIIGHTAEVTSSCRATGQSVRLTATPDGPVNVEPATAVVSLVARNASASIRSSFCNQVHFFTSADSAKDWLAEHPDAQVLPVADAYQAARPIIERALSAGPAPGCC